MISSMTAQRFILVWALTACLLLMVSEKRLQAQQQPFSFLQPGFSQDLFATAPLPAGEIDGGIAFAPNGDVWVDSCNRNKLFRFLAATTFVLNGSSVHAPAAGNPLFSNSGCGLTNHPDGTLYSNSGIGIINMDAGSGVQLRPAFGPAGNGLGIAVDPQTNRLVYVGFAGGSCFGAPPCTILSVDPITTAPSTFAQLASADATFIDGIFFDPSGNFLFMAVRSPDPGLTILNRSGAVIQHISIAGIPDGVGFHQAPDFVVTNNNDGTISRFDFPGGDFTLPPVPSLLANGGFRGDLTQVGADACLYATQAGTRFADGTTSADNSLVRICPGFVPPPGVLLPFAEFKVRDLDIVGDDDRESADEGDRRTLSLQGEFTPNAKSSGADPLHQAVTLSVGSFSITIPSGSFHGDAGHFVFDGKVNGVLLDFDITIDGEGGDNSDTGTARDHGSEFSFTARVRGLDLNSLGAPVTIGLKIGSNTAATKVGINGHNEEN